MITFLLIAAGKRTNLRAMPRRFYPHGVNDPLGVAFIRNYPQPHFIFI